MPHGHGLAGAFCVRSSGCAAVGAALPRRRRGAGTTPTTPGASDPLHEQLAARYRAHFPDRPPLRREDYADYLSVVPAWQKLFSRYDVVQAYATDPLMPLLCRVPYVAYEHGTIREIPFDDDARGRTTALAYAEADAVCITNIDNLAAARRLGLADARTIRLPHAVDDERLRVFHDRHRDLRPPDDVIRIVSPSRQDWVDADPNWTKGNDRLLRAFARVVESGRDCRLALVEWGRDLEASRALVGELGIDSYVEWLPTLRKHALWAEYLRSHAIADQFVLPAFGGVTFEALALGRRVITSLDQPLAAEFFGETPPLLASSSVDEIEAALWSVADDPDDRAGVGERAGEWFRTYHSSARILDLELAAYRGILEQPRRPR
jgi:glycosyltransferase involved in cell wall biosynthesis